MKTEELREEHTGKSPHFDAHEFDGLRDALEKEAENIFARLDQYIRDNPWTCIGLAVAAGFAVGSITRGRCSRDAAEQD